MEITLLYFDGCPSWQNALENLQTAIKEEDLDASIKQVVVDSDKKAADTKFLGSPSFQIDGRDLWPEERSSYSMNCRIYRTPEGLKGWPTVKMFRQKLQELSKGKDKGQ
jgi:hypothetical protein